MKVRELLANIKNKEFNLEKELQVKKYLPIEVKKTIAQGIIYDCTNDDNGAIKVDSVERYMSYVRYMITYHTNLEYTDDDYDMLCSTEYNGTNLLNAVIDLFGEDAKECSRILNLMMDDYMQEMSVEVSITRFLNNLNNYIGQFADKIIQKTDDIDLKSIIPEYMDMNKLNKFLQSYIK